jgi:hypothetical protein
MSFTYGGSLNQETNSTKIFGNTSRWQQSLEEYGLQDTSVAFIAKERWDGVGSWGI